MGKVLLIGTILFIIGMFKNPDKTGYILGVLYCWILGITSLMLLITTIIEFW